MYKKLDFEKQNIMEVYALLKDFIRNFKGGAEDEESLENLHFHVSKFQIGINKTMFKKINDFIENELEPMVYEHHHVFEKARSVGYVMDGVQHLDTEEELQQMCINFFEVLIEKEEQLNKFGMEVLYPYLIG